MNNEKKPRSDLHPQSARTSRAVFLVSVYVAGAIGFALIRQLVWMTTGDAFFAPGITNVVFQLGGPVNLFVGSFSGQCMDLVLQISLFSWLCFICFMSLGPLRNLPTFIHCGFCVLWLFAGLAAFAAANV